MAVQVDQVTGVGTVIKTGDYVDMVVGFTGDKFPVITLNPADDTFTVVSGLNSTSVKVLIQGMQVLGTLLPPPPARPTARPTTAPTTARPAARPSTGQQQIVILAVDAQQAEVIKFAQLDGSISLVLRSADDFLDPVTGAAAAGRPGPGYHHRHHPQVAGRHLRRPSAGAGRDRPPGAGIADPVAPTRHLPGR